MTELVKVNVPEEIERILVAGDLSKLNAEQRVTYYQAICERVGLDPITKPFDYLQLSGKTVLYANKNATEQLRRVHGVSVYKVERDKTDDTYAVTAYGRDASGREDAALGVVAIKGFQGDQLANAMMKAETKAKRRLTLSMCGLGMLDETEVETIPGAKRVEFSPVAAQEALAQAPPAPPTPPATASLLPPVSGATVDGFLNDFRSGCEKASDFVQLAQWCRQNVGIARKMACLGDFYSIKVKATLRLIEALDDDFSILVKIPGAVTVEHLAEFYAMDAVARKGGDLKVLFLELRPVLKDEKLDAQWVEYGKALKKEVTALKEA